VGSASIHGTVTDPTGAVLVGATVTVKNLQTGTSRILRTNSLGQYSAPEMQVGEYQVQTQMQGFQTGLHSGVRLTVGGRRVVDITLAVGQNQSTMEVQGSAPQVDSTSSTISSLIDQRQMRDLPLNGRNFEQLMLLAPGVQSVPSSGVGGAFYGNSNDYSISGGRPVGQALILDGAPIQNFWDHGTGAPAIGTSLGVEAIAEFQVFTNTYGAEFGGNGGGINAVTKSGTNSWHGSAYEFVRDSTFDARNYFDPLSGPPAFQRNQFGGTIGGPIRRDKLFFFVNYEGLRQDLGQTSITSVPDAAARAQVTDPATLAILDATPLPNLGDDPTTGIGEYRAVATQTAKENYLTARMDYVLSASDSIFGRYTLDRADLSNPFSVGPLGRYVESDINRNQFLTLGQIKLISSTLVNKAQFNFTRTVSSGNAPKRIPAFNFVPRNPLDGGLSVPGIGLLGVGYSVLPFNFVQTKFEVGDSIFWEHKANSITAGVFVRRTQSTTLSDIFSGGLFVYSAYGFNPGGPPLPHSFLSGAPVAFTGAGAGEADGTRSFREISLTGYVQDNWKLRPYLTVNLGLRYQFVSNPVEVNNRLNAIVNVVTDAEFTHVSHALAKNPSLRDLDPRLGFSWAITKDQKTALRAGFGLFHEVITARTYSLAYTLAPPYHLLTIVAPTLDNPFTFRGLSIPTLLLGQAIDYNLTHTPYVMQYNLNVQRDLGGGLIGTLGYVGSKGVHLLHQVEANPPILSLGSTSRQPIFTDPMGHTNPRVNPKLANIELIRPNANSHYNALQASATKRLSQGLDLRAFYTWSKCIDDSSSTYALEYDTGLQMNPYSLSQDRGLCAYSAAHVFNGAILYALPFRRNKFVGGWEVSGILTAQSGHPFTVLVGIDRAGLGSPNNIQRPNIAPGRSIGSIVTRNPKQWIDPRAFVLPSAGGLGNEPRNAFIGPRLMSGDVAIIKNTVIAEHLNVELRAEVFNVLNHTNLNPPAPHGLGSGVFLDNTGTVDPAAGKILSTATTSRQFQFSFKLIF